MADVVQNKIYIQADKQQENASFIQQLIDLPECERLPAPADNGLFTISQNRLSAGNFHNVLILEYQKNTWQIKSYQSNAILRFDFSEQDFYRRLSPNNLKHEYVVRAVRGRKAESALSVLDATAGLGRDAMLLAAAGCYVTAIEKIPSLALLVDQALLKAKNSSDKLLLAAAEKIQYEPGNSIDTMRNWQLPQPDVVYLDPMYKDDLMVAVKGLKASAAVKKHMAILQSLTAIYHENHSLDAANKQLSSTLLIETALTLAKLKVVVKRAPKAPWLGDKKPSSCLSGKAARFDVYAC